MAHTKGRKKLFKSYRGKPSIKKTWQSHLGAQAWEEYSSTGKLLPYHAPLDDVKVVRETATAAHDATPSATR